MSVLARGSWGVLGAVFMVDKHDKIVKTVTSMQLGSTCGVASEAVESELLLAPDPGCPRTPSHAAPGIAPPVVSDYNT